jgi:GTP-dependent phosphoenolpyruvate carboxykinase
MEKKIEYKDLVNMKDRIEQLPNSYQIEIGKIFNKNKVRIDENRNGLFINLSEVKKEILIELENFLRYVDEQEKHLKIIESLKTNLKADYFGLEEENNSIVETMGI